jgi:membrane-associated phospholipid phosphatase
MPGPGHYLSATLAQPAPAFGPGFWDGPPSRLGCAAIWLVQTGVLAAIYLRVNAATSGLSVATPLLPLESRIPLIAAAFPVYASLYLDLGLLIVLLRTWRAFVRMQTACLLACLIACLVYVLFPMSYPRPQLAEHGVAQVWLVAYWEGDGPACTFPSLHVTLAWLLAFSLGARSQRWRVAWWLNALAISVSTLLVKQHYVVDVAGGIVLAVASWRAAPGLIAWCEQRWTGPTACMTPGGLSESRSDGASALQSTRRRRRPA